ncbi:MAG: DUF6782 family putative metallopeptidase [Micavibrio sp.]
MRADRFERKSLLPKDRSLESDVIIMHYRKDGEIAGAPHALKAQKERAPAELANLAFGFESDADLAGWLCALASQSPTARRLLLEAQKKGWVCALDDLSGDGFALDCAEKRVTLDHFGFTARALGRSAHFRNTVFINFIRALRGIWHAEKGHDSLQTHHPEAAFRMERALQADCETVAMLAGWELRGAGHADIWRVMLGSDEGDMAMIFTRALETDPAGYYDGSALARAFCQWYGDEARVAAFDHKTLEKMDEILGSDEDGNGRFGAEPARGEAIEKIAVLPDGSPYLSGMGRNIAAEPYFTAIDDEVNEAHLAQITHDAAAIIAGGVAFRDGELAKKLFPPDLVDIHD